MNTSTLQPNQVSGKSETTFSEAPAYGLENSRRAAIKWNSTQEFDLNKWAVRLSKSSLSAKDQQTARDLAGYATSRGITKVSRDILAADAGVSRVATITARLKRIREAGLLRTDQRFNQSAHNLLCNPVGADANPLDKDVIDWPSFSDTCNPF